MLMEIKKTLSVYASLVKLGEVQHAINGWTRKVVKLTNVTDFFTFTVFINFSIFQSWRNLDISPVFGRFFGLNEAFFQNLRTVKWVESTCIAVKVLSIPSVSVIVILYLIDFSQLNGIKAKMFLCVHACLAFPSIDEFDPALKMTQEGPMNQGR